MFTQDQISEFRETGFIDGGRVMTDSQADELCGRLYAVIEGKADGQADALRNMTGDEENVVIQIVNIWQADPLFYAHLFNNKITSMTAQLIGCDTMRVWHDQVQYKPPRVGGPTLWHQDHPYWPVIEPADLVSCWVALEDAVVENGCMWMVPGSHKWGPHKGGTIGTDPETWQPMPDLTKLPAGISVRPVPCTVKKGHAVFHHCLTWHGAYPNRSELGRPAIAVHYMPGWTRYEPDPNRHHLVEEHIQVGRGEILQGDHFPTVLLDGNPVPVPQNVI